MQIALKKPDKFIVITITPFNIIYISYIADNIVALSLAACSITDIGKPICTQTKVLLNNIIVVEARERKQNEQKHENAYFK